LHYAFATIPEEVTTRTVLPKILIAEDDTAVRGLVAAALRRHPLEIHVAANGLEALALLQQHEYAVMLLDLMMPKIDGFALLESFARFEPRPNTVILVMTAFDESMIHRLDAQVVHAILRKPFEIEHLVELVTDCARMRAWQADDTELRHEPRAGDETGPVS
jgi:DNA-binding response OmpR family regulator